MPPTLEARRRVWLILWAAFTVAPVIYYVVANLVASGIAGGAVAAPGLATIRLVFAALALVQLGGGAFLMTRAPRMRGDVQGVAGFFGGESLATPEAFQLGFIVATAWIEACAILGFVLVFLGARPLEYVPFGAGSLTVMVAVALPVGRSYWAERERADGAVRAPID